MRFSVYILLCNDGSYYVGHTDDLPRRLDEHTHGRGGKYTRERLPVTLVYAETQSTKSTAMKRERELKGWSRSKKEALFK